MSRRRWLPVAVAAAVYLALAILVWWRLWAGGWDSTIPSGSADPAQNVWWLAWVPHAIGSGANPFFTRSMFWPAGVNVVSNASFLAVGLLLSPVTVLFGPLAAFSVAVTVVPAANALCAFLAIRRYVAWQPAAFVGALLYGFGPFAATDLRYGHLHVTVLVVPPLVLLALDELLVRRRRSPRVVGVWLALLVVVQFFISAEVLALLVVVAAVGLVVLLVGTRGSGDRRAVATDASMAFGPAAVISVAVLAYPAWWYLRGPRHFSGAVWGDMTRFGASLASFVSPHGETPGVGFISGGNGSYLGAGLVVVLVVGAVLLWRLAAMRFAGVMALACAVLALGSHLHVGHGDTGVPLPAWPLLHLPLFSSVVASRFALFVDLFAGMCLAIVVDRVWAWSQVGWEGLRSRWWSPLGAVSALTVVALLPAALSVPWPYPTRAVAEPPVLHSAALASLPAGAVVREYPPVSGSDADGLVWQAVEGIRYSTVDGYAIVPGPDGHASVRAPSDALDELFAAVYLGRVRPPFAASLVAAIRGHARDDDAAAIVVEAGAVRARGAAALVEAALGPPASSGPGGWVWLLGAP